MRVLLLVAHALSAPDAADLALEKIDGDVSHYDAEMDALTEQIPSSSLLEKGAPDKDPWSEVTKDTENFKRYNEHMNNDVLPKIQAEDARMEAETEQMDRLHPIKFPVPASFGALDEQLQKTKMLLLEDQSDNDKIAMGAGIPVPGHVVDPEGGPVPGIYGKQHLVGPHPSSFLEEDPKKRFQDFEKSLSGVQVEKPATWLEAAGFPTDSESKTAYADLDAATRLYRQEKKAYARKGREINEDIDAFKRHLAKKKAKNQKRIERFPVPTVEDAKRLHGMSRPRSSGLRSRSSGRASRP
jgi:hypothetical protein